MKKSVNDKLKLIKKMYHQGVHLEQVENDERKRSTHSHSQNASPKTSPKSHHSSKHRHHTPIYEEEPKITYQIDENPPIPKRRHTHLSKAHTNERNQLFINTGIQTNTSSIQASTPVPKSKLRQRLNNDSIEVAVRDLLQTQPPKTLPHRHHISSAFRKTDSPSVDYLSPKHRSHQQVEEIYERRNESFNNISHHDQDVQASPKSHTQKIYNGSSKSTKKNYTKSIYSPMGVYQRKHDDIKNFVVFDVEPSPSNSPLNSPLSQNSYKKQSPSPIEIPNDNNDKQKSNTYTAINHRVNSTEILSENSFGEFNANKSETTTSSYTKFTQNSSQNDLKSQEKEEGLPKLNKPRPTNVIDLYQDITDTNDSFGKELDQIEKQEIQQAKDEIEKEKKDEEDFDNLLEDAEETIQNEQKEQKEQDEKMKQQIEQQIYKEFEEDDNETDKERDKIVIQTIQTTIETVTKTEIDQKHLLNIKQLEEDHAADLLSVSDSQNEEENQNENDQFLNENDENENEIENDFLDEEDKNKAPENDEKIDANNRQTFEDFDKLVKKDDDKNQLNENVQPPWVLDEDENKISTNDFISSDLIKDESNNEVKINKSEVNFEEEEEELNDQIKTENKENDVDDENYQIEIDGQFDENEEDEINVDIQNQSNSNNSIQIEGDEITESANQNQFEFNEEEEENENENENLFQLDVGDKNEEKEETTTTSIKNQFEAENSQLNSNNEEEDSSKNQFEAEDSQLNSNKDELFTIEVDDKEEEEEEIKLNDSIPATSPPPETTTTTSAKASNEEDKNQPGWVVDNENEVNQDEIDDIFNDFEPDSKEENENQPVTLDEVDENGVQLTAGNEVNEEEEEENVFDQDQNEFDLNGQLFLGEEEEEEEAEMANFDENNEFDADVKIDKMGEEDFNQQNIESSNNQIQIENVKENGQINIDIDDDEEEDDEGAVMQIMIDEDEEDIVDEDGAVDIADNNINMNESDGQALIKDDSEPFKKYYDSLSGSDKPPNNYFDTFSPDSLNQSGGQNEDDLNTEN